MVTEAISCYSLKTLRVSPNQLLLDPSNPRLITDGSEDDRSYTSEQIQSPKLQKYVLGKVSQDEHHVRHLIDGIRQTGFLGGVHEMIVKRLDHDRFLVIEGNRRAAALQHLLGSPGSVTEQVLATIREIEVKEFIYKPNESYEEEDVIDVILGTIHIDGPEEWGALQKARYIFKSYARAFLREWGEAEELFFDNQLAEQVGQNFNLKAPSVRVLTTVYRVYEQMRIGGFKVLPSHYSLLEMAVKTRAVRDYFELDWEICALSDTGLERFAALCLGDAPPVHNPGLFRGFVFIVKNGTTADVEAATSGARQIDAVKRKVRGRLKTTAFRDELAAIRSQIGAMKVTDFQGTKGEKQEIRRLRKIVNEKLWPLARRR